MIKKFNENWNTFYDYIKGESENKVNFDKNIEIIGLPTGQIIYMTPNQIKYFKSRDFIRFMNTWKKPISGGFIPIKVERYCFEDVNYKTIIDLIEAITW